MSVSTPSTLTFTGDAVLGRVPPRLFIRGGVELTPQQVAGVVTAYRKFFNLQRLSLAAHFQHVEELEDGTRVRMVSNSGTDVIYVDPPGTGAEVVVAEYFRAIPANETNVSGSGALPSKSWKLPGAAVDWPDELKDASTLANHPGHVIWCNTDLKFFKLPIVVSWRGPRDRYAISTGWAGALIVAHEEAAATIGTTVYKDSGYVWIDGRRVDTGLTKVVAACICQPDPSGDPGKYVLRVCTDYIAGARGYKIVDLAPGGAAVGLGALCEAKTLAAVSTYTAANFHTSPTGMQWDMLQRPHFNKSGTKLASIIQTASGYFGAVFDAVTWAIDSTVNTPTSQSLDIVRSSATAWTGDSTSNASKIVAMDFDGDTPVWLHTYFNRSTHEVASNGEGVTGQGIHSVLTNTFDWGIIHSSLGTLFSSTATGTDEVTVDGAHSPPTSGSYTRGASPDVNTQFIGDLARRTFAIGYTTATASESGTGTTFVLGASISGTNVVTNHETRLTFDVYFDNVQVATGTTGAFTNAASATNTSGVFIDYTSYVTTPPNTSTSSSTTGGGGVSFANSNGGTPGFGVQHKNCAVHPLRTIAYFGALFYQPSDTVDRAHIPRFGLEFGAFDPGSGVTSDNPPAYAAGSFPTLDAPVFMGPSITGPTP